VRRARTTGDRERFVLPVLCVTLATALALTAPAVGLGASQIRTKGGTTYEGSVVREEGDQVVIETSKGTIRLSRDDIAAIQSLEKKKDWPERDPEAPRITPVVVTPDGAREALVQAREAVKAGKWVKAGGLLEGLAELKGDVLSADDRRGITSSLATCYLQIDDPRGAARSFGRRAMVAKDDGERRRILAAAEALATSKSTRIGGQTVRTYKEAIPAAVKWKVDQIVKTARKITGQARLVTVKARLDRTAQGALKKLKEADLYEPGTSDRERTSVLRPLVDNVMQGAQAAVNACSRERRWFDANRWRSLSDKETVKRWVQRVAAYLALRQGAEDGVQNLRAFASRFDLGGLYNDREAKRLLDQLEDLKYYPPRGGRQIKILPRRTGGAIRQ